MTQWLAGKLCPSPSSFSPPPPRPDSLTGFESSVLDIPSIGTCQENFSVRVPTYKAPSWSCKWVLENLGKQELIDSLIKHNKKGFWLVYMIIEQSSGAMVKNPPAMQETQETQVQTLDGEDPLEKEMATHSSILAWKIPWTETLATVCYSLLQSVGLQRVWHDWVIEHESPQENSSESITLWRLRLFLWWPSTWRPQTDLL